MEFIAACRYLSSEKVVGSDLFKKKNIMKIVAESKETALDKHIRTKVIFKNKETIMKLNLSIHTHTHTPRIQSRIPNFASVHTSPFLINKENVSKW